MKHKKASWTDQIVRRDCLLGHVIEGKIKRMRIRRVRCKQLLDNLRETRGYWKFGNGSTRSHSEENSLWKKLWACRKTDYMLMIMVMMMMMIMTFYASNRVRVAV